MKTNTPTTSPAVNPSADETENTPMPFVPDGLKITVLSKWIDWKGREETDYSGKPTGNFSPVFRFKLELRKDDCNIFVDYSGGVLAFASDEVRAKFNPLNQTRDDVEGLFSFAEINPLDVLHSLIMDTQAGSESFPEFCSTMGCDEDSRKAFATWEACQKTGADFRRVLGSPALFNKLETAFQDY